MNGAPGVANSLQSLLRKPWVGSPFFSINSNANGFTRPVGWLPALNAFNFVRFHFRDPPDNNEGDQRILAERSDEALWINVYMKAR